MRNIENHCVRSGLKHLLNEFKKKAEEGVTNLLLAFYFRQSGLNHQGDKTFEFTHKSFGEYLTAKRIVREVRLIHKKLEARQKDPDDGCDETDALQRWVNLCLHPMDEYLFKFVLDEMCLQNPLEVADWQQTLCHLFSFMLSHEMPMERLNSGFDFSLTNWQARNAEEALLAVLNACARVTKKISHIQHPYLDSFGTLISRLRGQRVNGDVLCLNYLSFLDLQGSILLLQDFLGANLEAANLESALLIFANLIGSNLQKANLQKVELQSSILIKANLQSSNLKNANLAGANLVEANLVEANLVEANLADANLALTNLKSANLEGANLTGANLTGANLTGANLSAANLTEAILHRVNNYENANFKGQYGSVKHFCGLG